MTLAKIIFRKLLKINVISLNCYSTCKATSNIESDLFAVSEKCKMMDVVKPRSRQGPAKVSMMRDDGYNHAKYRGEGMCWRRMMVTTTPSIEAKACAGGM